MAHLVVVDTANLIKRAFFRPGDRSPGHAVRGFHSLLRGLIRTLKPTHLIATLEGDCVFRRALFPGYKLDPEKREGPSARELIAELLPHLIEWGVCTAVDPGHEADDVMGTLARRASAVGTDVTIVTRDRDLLQVVDEHVSIYDHMSGARMGPQFVRETYGVEPAQFAEFRALVGDSSDKIPRCALTIDGREKRVTDALAARYLRMYGSLDGLFRFIHLLPADEGEVLLANRAQIGIFREVVRLRTDLPLEGLDVAASSIRRSIFAPFGPKPVAGSRGHGSISA